MSQQFTMRERSPHARIELESMLNKTDEQSTSVETTVIEDEKSKRPQQKLQPPLWNTKEFYFYYFLFCTIVPFMLWTAYDISSEDRPGYYRYGRYLSQGWIFGRKIDNTDAQYREFRNNIPILCATAVVFILISQILDRFSTPDPQGGLKRNFYARRLFYLISSTIFMTVVCGANLLKILFILSLNYGIAKLFGGSRWNPLITWIFNLIVLIFNDQFGGYGFDIIHPSLAFLDNYRGLMPRWEIHFKFAMLRMISFNMDYYWACRHDYQPLNIKVNDPEKARIQTSHKLDQYNYLNYIVYIFYIPLFVAGPIITFNNFIAQMHFRPATIQYKSTILYGLRVFGCMLLMEFMMHYFYVVVISKTQSWIGFTAFEISMVGYFNLKFIWLKLLVIWRFFRLWAMADGIEVTENMHRCMSNNYSAQGFWRSWHRSYNRWLIRYVYIPLGGSKYAAYNMWPVFTFVAVWHDVSFKLLTWAWLICLFILPELILTRLTRPYQDWRYYRHLCALGAVGNLFMMIIANLVGFAVGVDGIQEMLRLILTPSGITFLILAPCALFCAAQLMFEIRECEKRRGITTNNF